MSYPVLLIIFLFFFSCQSNSNKVETTLKNSEQNTTKGDYQLGREKAFDTSDINFFSVCDEMESWIGKIQYPKRNSTEKKFGFMSCNSGIISFDMIFDLKSNYEESELSNRFTSIGINGYNYFNIFVFTIPMRDKNEFEKLDPSGDPNIYPSKVKAYRYTDSRWVYINDAQVNNLQEYSDFQLDIILK